MQSVAEEVNSTIQTQIKVGRIRECGICPICQSMMLVFVDKQTGEDRSLPACPVCSYCETNGKKQVTRDFSLIARKSDAYNYLTNSSTMSDTDLLNQNFDNFNVTTERQRFVFDLAKRIAEKAVSGEVIHGIFSGPTGTGKSHLSMGIIYYVLKQSEYRQKCAFIDIRELLSQMKRGFKDKEIARRYDLVFEKAKTADFLVVDDLGSETTGTTSGDEASRFNLEVVTNLLQARMNKTTVINTNLTGADLSRIYGDRILSRIMSHSKGYVAQFKGIEDHRINN